MGEGVQYLCQEGAGNSAAMSVPGGCVLGDGIENAKIFVVACKGIKCFFEDDFVRCLCAVEKSDVVRVVVFCEVAYHAHEWNNASASSYENDVLVFGVESEKAVDAFDVKRVSYFLVVEPSGYFSFWSDVEGDLHVSAVGGWGCDGIRSFDDTRRIRFAHHEELSGNKSDCLIKSDEEAADCGCFLNNGGDGSLHERKGK